MEPNQPNMAAAPAKAVVVVKHPFTDLVVGKKYAYTRPLFSNDPALKGKTFEAEVKEIQVVGRKNNVITERRVVINGSPRMYELKELPHDAVLTEK